MKLGFYGAAKEVTGSKHMVTLDGGTCFLLDCGMFQGSGPEMDEWNANFGFNVPSLDFMILSHAHIDHSGLIPKLVKDGFRGKIYCTAATRDLCEVMLEDSARIQEGDIRFINKKRKSHGDPPLQPLYDVEDAKHALTLFHSVDYDKNFSINEQVTVRFTDNGHILGSAAVNLTLQENGNIIRLLFSGDIGRYNNRILKTPEAVEQADYIITESTYGDREHDADPDLKEKLNEIVKDCCVINRGKLIIPAFSVGRTQEVLSALNDLQEEGKLPRIRVFVDSPLSEAATEIISAHPECYNERMQAFMKQDPDPFGFKGLTFTQSKEESQNLNGLNEPCIIISASGMAEAGRVKHHILHNITNPKNTILFVGYCSPYSLGGKLINGAKEVRIFGDMFPVKAQVKKLNGFSAHGDYKEMLRFLDVEDKRKVKKVFLVHGDPNVMNKYRIHLTDSGFKEVYIPDYKEEVSNLH